MIPVHVSRRSLLPGGVPILVSILLVGALAVGLLVLAAGDRRSPGHEDSSSVGRPPGSNPDVQAPAAERNPWYEVHGVIPDVNAGSLTTPSGFSFDLEPVAAQPLPKDVDSNSPAFWDGPRLFVFTSAFYDDPGVFRSSGTSVDDLGEPVRVEMPVLDRPGNIWMESVWLDPSDHTLYGWYHLEPADLDCSTAAIIGAAVSHDDGLTWEDRGFVLQNPFPVDCEYDNGYMAGGVGDFSVIVDPGQNFFYLLFSNYGGPVEEQGISIARSPFSERGQPGTFETYYNGEWVGSSLANEATPLFGTSTGWKGPYIDSYWGPSVHWNTYLNSYVALINRTAGEQYVEEGVYIIFSQDLVHWTEPEKILDGGSWYGQVIGLGYGESDSIAGQSMLVYNDGIAYAKLTFQ